VTEGVGIGCVGEGVAIALDVGVAFTSVGEAVGKMIGVWTMGLAGGASGEGRLETGSAAGEIKAERASLLKRIIRPKAIKTLIVIISPALAEPSSLGESFIRIW